MAVEPKYIDLDDDSDLARLAEEVATTHEPRQLRRNGRVIAVVNVPSIVAEDAPGGETAGDSAEAEVRTRRIVLPPKKVSEADRQAFLSSLGGWRDIVDTDALLKQIYKHREMSMPRQFAFDESDDDASR